MFCPECGVQNKSSAKFCEQCGSGLGTTTSLPTNGKPLGIVVIVIITVISGVAEIAVGSSVAAIPNLMGLVTTGLTAIGGQGEIDTSVHIASLKIAGIAASLFASGIFTVAAAYGLWNFIGWGRVLAVVLYGIGLFVGLILFFTSLGSAQTAGAIALQLMGFAITAWMLIYLFRSNIRDLFHGAKSSGLSVYHSIDAAGQRPVAR
jgi:uncharacterized membrane protein (DUF2068 family)